MKCCDINAGKLRTPIKLERKTTTPDGAGGFVTTWQEYANTKAYVKALSGMERFVSERVESQVKYTAVIRFRDIKASDRVIIDHEAYNIVAVYDVEMRKQWLKLDLALGQAQ